MCICNYGVIQITDKYEYILRINYNRYQIFHNNLQLFNLIFLITFIVFPRIYLYYTIAIFSKSYNGIDTQCKCVTTSLMTIDNNNKNKIKINLFRIKFNSLKNCQNFTINSKMKFLFIINFNRYLKKKFCPTFCIKSKKQ